MIRKDKWYSHGLSWEEIDKLEKKYGKIQHVNYSDLNGERLVCFSIVLEDGLVGGCNLRPRDAEQLFTRTKVSDISGLRGKVIEAYLFKTPGRLSVLRGISVNENLV